MTARPPGRVASAGRRSGVGVGLAVCGYPGRVFRGVRPRAGVAVLPWDRGLICEGPCDAFIHRSGRESGAGHGHGHAS